MHCIEIELIEIIQNQDGDFISAHQICDILEKTYPKVWSQLVNEYPSPKGHREIVDGTHPQYSPATFVAKAFANVRVKSAKF